MFSLYTNNTISPFLCIHVYLSIYLYLPTYLSVYLYIHLHNRYFNIPRVKVLIRSVKNATNKWIWIKRNFGREKSYCVFYNVSTKVAFQPRKTFYQNLKGKKKVVLLQFMYFCVTFPFHIHISLKFPITVFYFLSLWVFPLMQLLTQSIIITLYYPEVVTFLNIFCTFFTLVIGCKRKENRNRDADSHILKSR